MIKVAIVDDDVAYTKQLTKFFLRFEEAKEYYFDITHFPDAIEFLRSYSADFDIVFMDIKMPYINGLEAARQLRNIDKEVVLIFITSLAQYAIEGYTVDALDYILKPVTYENFVLKLSRAMHKVKKKEADCLVLKTIDSIVKINIENICYVESMEHHVIYHVGNQSFECFSSLKQVAETLKSHHFSFCNSCYLVNLRCVSAIKENIAYLGKESLTISQGKKKSFLSEWKQFGAMV